MFRWMTLLLFSFLVACGGDKDPQLGGTPPPKKDDNNPNIVNFPDVGPDDQDTGSTTPHDVGGGEDAAPASDVSEPVEDMGQDSGSEPDTSVNEPDATPNPCPRMNRNNGQTCNCDSECQSGLCNGNQQTEGICIAACTSASDCPGTQVCASLPSGRACVDNDTATSCMGSNETSNPTMCNTLRCLRGASNLNSTYNLNTKFFCSVECNSSSDCQSGQACTPSLCHFEVGYGYHCRSKLDIAGLSDNERGQILLTHTDETKMCVPVGKTLLACNPSDREVCDGRACFTGMSLSRCTAGCEDTSDCPTGACEPQQSPADLPVSYCRL